MKKYLITVVCIVLLVIIFLPIYRSISFNNIDVNELQLIEETISPDDRYVIKIYYKAGPMSFWEYSYVGALFDKGTFIRNVFWIGPNGNDFEVDWKGSDTIILTNVENNQVSLDVQKEIYDFRSE
jgi:hypothetical protein